MSRKGVTAHGGPCGTLQFDRLGSRPWPPHLSSRNIRRVRPAKTLISWCAEWFFCASEAPDATRKAYAGIDAPPISPAGQSIAWRSSDARLWRLQRQLRLALSLSSWPYFPGELLRASQTRDRSFRVARKCLDFARISTASAVCCWH